MMGMFLNYQNIANNYIPNNLVKAYTQPKSYTKLDPVDASKPYESYDVKGNLVGYFWNYRDVLNLEFNLDGEITVETDAIIYDTYGKCPDTCTQARVGQRCYNIVDLKSWTCVSIVDNIYNWVQDTEFIYPERADRSVYISASDYLKDKQIYITLYNFRYEPVVTRSFEGKDKVIFEIDATLSEELVKGIYYCSVTVKSEEVTITVTPAPDEGKTILFAEGVTPESGWYDVNKIGNGQINGDINMCWAATSSNIIQWWQDRYVAAGNTLPEGAVTGEGITYQLALMEMFHKQWDNSKGADATHGVVWYFQGINVQKNASPGSCAQPLEGNNGGYFASIWDEILPHVYHEYSQGGYNNLISQEYNNYTNWYKDENWVDYTNPERYARISDFVKTFIENNVTVFRLIIFKFFGILIIGMNLYG